MTSPKSIAIGAEDGRLVAQPASTVNRHGLIAGATGTGKTVTLQVMAEAYSRLGVPVFAADIKGDLSGVARAGRPHPKIDERLAKIPLESYEFSGSPVVLWDIFGESGHALRTTISEVGPLLLSSLLQLNDTQTGVIYAVFRIADDNGMLLLDLKDLRALLSWVGEHARELKTEYGNLSSSSIAAIQRRLLMLEEQGAESFFGEPAVTVKDLMARDFSGRGVIHLLDATRLVARSPQLYATFLLWLLAELFEELPEKGNPEKPEFVMFFDEAHLLFDQAPRPLLEKIEQVARLIRSKGVGVYFVTQNPRDIPDDVAGQLGLRIQHALRAYTAKERKSLKAVAESFRDNPELDLLEVLTELGTGEALVSVLNEDGSPSIVQRTLIRPPESRIGPLTEAERTELLERSPFKGRFDQAIDRESAYEELARRAAALHETRKAEEAAKAAEAEERARKPERSGGRRSNRQGVGEALVKSAVRTIGRQLGSKLVRGVLGSLLGKR